MNEAYLKAKLKRRVLEDVPGAVIFRHEDKFTGGVPDMSVSRRGACCWVEVKFHRNGRPSRPTAKQEVALRNLRGLLVTYCVVRGRKSTVLKDYEPNGPLVPGQSCSVPGFDHGAAAFWIASKLDRASFGMRETSEVDLVRAFHEKFDLPRPDAPAFSGEALSRRAEHIEEEVGELKEAIAEQDLAKVADAIVDVTYLALGSAVNSGLPWRQLFLEVHRANMDKQRAPGSSSQSTSKQGIIKPAGWRGPDVAGVLRRAGWTGKEEA